MSTTAAIQIRQATAADAARLAELATQLGYPSGPEEAMARLAVATPYAQHAVFVAENGDGRVVGWVDVQRFLVMAHDPVAEVTGLVVDAGCRRSGAGRALMRRAEEWAREHGLSRLLVRSNIIRHDAHAFYEGIGYSRLKTQVNFLKKL